MKKQSIELAKEFLMAFMDMHDNIEKEGTTTNFIHFRDNKFPIFLVDGHGKWIEISPYMDKIANKLGESFYRHSDNLKVTHKKSEYISIFRTAIGQALTSIDTSKELQETACVFLNRASSITKRFTQNNEQRVFFFGCTMLNNDDIVTVKIGPIVFEHRMFWLRRMHNDRKISEDSYNRILEAWKGNTPRKRMKNADVLGDNDIIEVLDPCSYVCSVPTTGFSYQTGEEKALLSARIALTVLALLWERSSKALLGFNLLYDGTVRVQKILSCSSDRIAISSISKSRFLLGSTLDRSSWEKSLQEYKDVFATAEHVITYLLSFPVTADRAILMNRFVHSLFWFHQACCEETSLIAIVKFSASMDALANGQGKSGIYRILESQLGMSKSHRIYEDGTTVKNAIEKIYGHARSRTIHGTNPEFGYDWMETRELAEWLAKNVLIECMDWVGKNPTLEDPKALQNARNSSN